MSKIEARAIYICDVCEGYSSEDVEDFERYMFQKRWSSGSHEGYRNDVFHVCDKCEAAKGIRKLWLRWKSW